MAITSRQHFFPTCYGSDFTARDTKRLFASTGIETILSDPYQPQQKGHIERGIGTFQRDVGPLLPGFIGHSVTDRKAIESRKSFAARLGEKDAETFGVSLTGQQLQAYVDQWADEVYQHAEHSGIGGKTPFQMAMASTRPIRRIDERALDLLLMPVAGGGGMRKVTKFGVRIDGPYYMAPTVPHGTVVFVRQDPNDLGRAYLFEEDGGRFLSEAICPSLSGIDPATYVREAKALQRELVEERTKPIREEARRIAKGPKLIERVFNVARRDAPNVIPLPKREETHSTPQIVAAIEAMSERVQKSRPLTPAEEAERARMIADDEAALFARTDKMLQRRQDEIAELRVAHLPKDEKIVALPETPKQRYRRAVEFRRRLEADMPMNVADAHWLGGYERSPEFKAHQQMHEDFGEDWLTS